MVLRNLMQPLLQFRFSEEVIARLMLLQVFIFIIEFMVNGLEGGDQDFDFSRYSNIERRYCYSRRAEK